MKNSDFFIFTTSIKNLFCFFLSQLLNRSCNPTIFQTLSELNNGPRIARMVQLQKGSSTRMSCNSKGLFDHRRALRSREMSCLNICLSKQLHYPKGEKIARLRWPYLQIRNINRACNSTIFQTLSELNNGRSIASLVRSQEGTSQPRDELFAAARRNVSVTHNQDRCPML